MELPTRTELIVAALHLRALRGRRPTGTFEGVRDAAEVLARRARQFAASQEGALSVYGRASSSWLKRLRIAAGEAAGIHDRAALVGTVRTRILVLTLAGLDLDGVRQDAS